MVGSLSGAWVVVFGVFLLLVKKKYRRTFSATTMGKQQMIDRFGAVDEAVKASVVKKNKQLWRAIREDVKEWVQANWWRWKEEKPEWFDLACQSKVPEGWITDAEERARLDKAREKGRRRSSVDIVKGVFGKVDEEVRVGGRVEPVA